MKNKGDIATLWMASTRYFLGRMTIATHSFGSMLESNWHEIPESAKKIILRDLKEAIERDDGDRERGSSCKSLGMDMDSVMWRTLYGKINNTINKGN